MFRNLECIILQRMIKKTKKIENRVSNELQKDPTGNAQGRKELKKIPRKLDAVLKGPELSRVGEGMGALNTNPAVCIHFEHTDKKK